MNIQDKIKEIGAEIATLSQELESKTVRLKLLQKSKKAFEKLLEKAGEIEMPK